MCPHSGSTCSRAPAMCSATSREEGSGTTWSWPPARTRVGARISPSRLVTNELGSSVRAAQPGTVPGGGNRLQAGGRGERPAGGASPASPPGRIWSAIRRKNSPHSPRSPRSIHSCIRGAIRSRWASQPPTRPAPGGHDRRVVHGQPQRNPPAAGFGLDRDPAVRGAGCGDGHRDRGGADSWMEECVRIRRVVRDGRPTTITVRAARRPSQRLARRASVPARSRSPVSTPPTTRSGTPGPPGRTSRSIRPPGTGSDSTTGCAPAVRASSVIGPFSPASIGP